MQLGFTTFEFLQGEAQMVNKGNVGAERDAHVQAQSEFNRR
jgi:hypothetical protein